MSTTLTTNAHTRLLYLNLYRALAPAERNGLGDAREWLINAPLLSSLTRIEESGALAYFCGSFQYAARHHEQFALFFDLYDAKNTHPGLLLVPRRYAISDTQVVGAFLSILTYLNDIDALGYTVEAFYQSILYSRKYSPALREEQNERRAKIEVFESLCAENRAHLAGQAAVVPWTKFRSKLLTGIG